jgi:hypothetical protein
MQLQTSHAQVHAHASPHFAASDLQQQLAEPDDRRLTLLRPGDQDTIPLRRLVVWEDNGR